MNRIRIYSGIAALLTVLFFYQNYWNKEEVNTQPTASKEIEQVTKAPEPVYLLDTTHALRGPAGSTNGRHQLFVITDKEPQYFTIDNSKDTTVTCKEGTKLTIPANAFVSKTTHMPSGIHVSVSVKEYYSNTDIILAGLTTSSGKDMLETGGMIYVDAVSENESCDLAEGKKMEIHFPAHTKKENMQVFNGETKNGIIDWKAAEKTPGEPDELIVNEISEQADLEYLTTYIRKTLRYPESCLETCVSGKVFVQFEVKPDGSIKKAHIRKGLHPALDREVMRVMAGAPKIKPASYNGKNVRMRYTLPINFKATDCDRAYIPEKDYVSPYSAIPNDDTSEVGVESYALSSAKLGWINCDRFVNIANKINFVTGIPYDDNTSVSMLFHNISSVMPADFTPDDKICFRNIPANEPVTLLGFKRAGNKIFMAIHKGNSSNTAVQLIYRETSAEEIKKQMKKLDLPGQPSPATPVL